MFYYKKLLLKKVLNKTITFSAFSAGMNTTLDQSMLPAKYAKMTYNYTFKDGALKNGMGFSELMLPTSHDPLNFFEIPAKHMPNNLAIKSFWQFRRYLKSTNRLNSLIVMQAENGQLYAMSVVAPAQGISALTSNKPTEFSGNITGVNYHLNGNDALLLFVPEQEKILNIDFTGFVEVVEQAPKLVDIAVHHERLFAIEEGDRKRLRFSANLDPINWNLEMDEGGFIDFRDERGKILKLVSFNDYLYVFREYGVSRVSAYGNQEEFSVTHLYISSSQIYAQSVVACGDRILFFTNDGLFVFDGYSGNKITLGIENLLKSELNHNCKGVFFENKYYLALRLNFADEQKVGCENNQSYVNNALLEYNIQTGDVCIMRGVDVLDMISLKESVVSKLVACFRGENSYKLGQLDYSGKFFGQSLKSVWQAPKTNFGLPGKTKILKQVLINTKSDCEVVVKSGNQTKTYALKGNQNLQKVKTNVVGDEMEIAFVTNHTQDTHILAPQITIGVVE